MKSKKTIFWGVTCVLLLLIFIYLQNKKSSVPVFSSIHQAQIDEFNKENLVSIDPLKLSEVNDAKAIIKQGKDQRTFVDDRLINI